MPYKDHLHVIDFLKKNYDNFRPELKNRGGFDASIRIFDNQWQLIKQLVDVAGSKELFQNFEKEIDTFVNHWLIIYKRIEQYEPISDQAKNNQEFNDIMQSIDSFNSYIFSAKTNGHTEYLKTNFLALYGAVMSMRTNMQDIQEDIERIKSNRKDSEQIVIGLRQIAADQTFLKYSKIFTDESSRYSSPPKLIINRQEKEKLKGLHLFRFWKFLSFRIGSAELWLFAGFSLTFFFGYIIFNGEINRIFPIINKDGELVQGIVTRLLGISLWIYLISFSFKQFSINKHLATLNKHRANALNSFTLFKETIDRSDTSSRNALMLEVAKAIYDQGSTGHLTSKSKDAVSVIEMTKILGNSSPS